MHPNYHRRAIKRTQQRRAIRNGTLRHNVSTCLAGVLCGVAMLALSGALIALSAGQRTADAGLCGAGLGLCITSIWAMRLSYAMRTHCGR